MPKESASSKEGSLQRPPEPSKPKARRTLVIAAGERELSPSVLGGKGYGLAEMIRMGIPVPPGFTISTTAARAFMQHDRLPERLAQQLMREIHKLERQTHKKFGSAYNPLLVSVRSGAEVSMPGMMDTVLNLGLNPETVEALTKQTKSETFAYDCYRRFLTMFADVVLKINRQDFDLLLSNAKNKHHAKNDADLPAEALNKLCERYRQIIETHLGRPMPDDPLEQLSMAIVAVFQSWNTERAKIYREAHLIPDFKGTAVTVQTMVFGNRDDQSGTGVVFSRNVTTGRKGLYGEFLPKAQGEDVVAGIRTPEPIEKLTEWNPRLHEELQAAVEKLAASYQDIVDVEFTIEQGKLYILQSRKAKRTPEAQATVAFETVRNIKDPKKRAAAIVDTIAPETLQAANRPSFDPKALAEAESKRIASGLPVSPGAVTGIVALTSESAKRLAATGQIVILVRPDTSPDDLPGMMAAKAIVTETGGTTSHAAVVARGMNIPAVVGASTLHLKERDVISVDANTGHIYQGRIPLTNGIASKELALLLKWVKQGKEQGGAPRLALEKTEAHISFNTLCNDFYLVDAMARDAAGTPLGREALVLKKKIHAETAAFIAAYLLLACAGEARHDSFYGSHSSAALGAQNTLQKKFGLSESDRSYAQARITDQMIKASSSEQIEALHTLYIIFSEARWSSGYGGPAWAHIAETAEQYLNGTMDPSIFVDHAFDLQHNGGCVFNKRDEMISGDQYILRDQLNAKKQAKTTKELRTALQVFSTSFSDSVQDLWQKGLKMDIWK